jgi:imidazolonepropionase-like amidohydrolase/Tol biopolymer transport system component
MSQRKAPPASLVTLVWVVMLGIVMSQPAGAQDAAAWDVTEAHGPSKTVRFTTTEGTWMNVDVSPDGREILFDLFGDIYVMPIEGGQARRITSGPAFDVQARYSPDGSRISMTSDRAGGDNIWVMNRDGSSPRQITTEDLRLLNNAAWTPDGQYLVARKHFTSTRSLGAGEMWLYHVTGGSGVQLMQRKNDQQDAGEPDVSPDGRYVFFSEDMTPGPLFQYNKNPHAGIYAIRAYDRETGEMSTLIGGAGGAVRPRVSPDGRYIAFVRRVRTESVLYLYDRETGAEIPLYDGMSHDQQEAWAIFGPYPNYAWTPDSRTIVFWARGGLHRIDIASKQVQAIPFEAEIEQILVEPVRFAQAIAPARFEAKMLRGAETSPDGQWLVFEAIGKLWRKRLPSGAPERITTDTLFFEQDPSFSPDGQSLVYTTWHDDSLSAIRSIPLTGGASRNLTTRPGYYHTPRYSPDGERLVYRRGTGNVLLGFVHGLEPGLYWMPAGGGMGTKIRADGSDPRFDETGERIYFQTGGGLEKQYRSVRVDGGDERTHFTMHYATDVVPSPDGRWVAFTELFNAYVAPFPATGKAFDLNKDTRAVPITRVTRDAGTDLHWSADGQRLHWMIGPQYFTRAIAESFTFVAGGPDSVPPPDTAGIRVDLMVTSDVPTGRVAIVGGRIVTMRGNEVIEDGTVLIEGNRITAVGPRASIQVPAGAHVIDAAGHTIVPGIIDAHAHANHFFDGPMPRRNWTYLANLAYGITTSHDPSANTGTVFAMAERVRAGALVGPRIFSTGSVLYGADGDTRVIINSLDDARSHLRRMKAVGAFSVKSYNQPRREQRQQILQAARELEMLVVPEGGSTFYHNLTMILDGHTGIEHNIPVAPLYRDVMDVWKETAVGYTPTLVVSYGGLSGEFWWYGHDDVWKDTKLLTFTPRSIVDARSIRRLTTPDDDYWHIEIAQQAKKLIDLGGTVQLGAHGQLQGLGAHWELWMFVQGGMTPHEAFRSATLHGARYLGLDADLGSIESGKLADLIVIEGNPLANVRLSTQVRYTVINGRVFDAATMNQAGNHSHERGPLWWEKPSITEAAILR